MRSLGRFASVACLAIAFLTAFVASAAASPVYDVKATWGDTNLPPGGEAQFTLQARNIGDSAAEEEFAIKDELPEGVTVREIHWEGSEDLSKYCSGVGTRIATCTIPQSEASILPDIAPAPGLKDDPSVGLFAAPSGYLPLLFIGVEVDEGAAATGTNKAIVTGGGATLPGGGPCAKDEAELGTLPACAEDTDQLLFSEEPAHFGFVAGSFAADVFKHAYPDQETSRQAGDHPFEQRIDFDLTAELRHALSDGTLETPSHGTPKTIEFTLPRGLIGNPEALPKCDPFLFATLGAAGNSTACPANTQLGYLNVFSIVGGGRHGSGIFFNPNELSSRVPIYSLEPPRGTPVDLAFNASGVIQGHVFAALDPADGYAIKAVVPNITAVVNPRGSESTVWGVPGDPAHDKFRYFPSDTEEKPPGNALGAPFGGTEIRAFFTNPMDCGFPNGGTRVRADSYQEPGQFTEPEENQSPLDVEGCDDPRFRFEPDVSLQPTDRHAGAPTGLDVHLEVPQRNDEAPEAKQLYAEEGFVKGIGTPPISEVVVTFPEGMTLNPSAAQGLQGCTLAQIGLEEDTPVKCPDASQYGTLTLHTPLFPPDAQPKGFIYIAKQKDNFFGNFLSLYLVIEELDRGIRIKLPGRLDLDPETGQITATFEELPQFPVSDMQLTVKGGVRAGLVEPSTCGKKTITAEFFTWQDPETPHTLESSYEITEKPDGSPCVGSLGARPFGPSLEAGTANPIGGAFSPFVMRLTRTDDDQEFSRLGVKLPPGLAAKFAGVGICPDAGIAQAISRTGAGDGALEQSNSSCPASSEIGTTDVGAGVGVPLTYVPGKVYLAGPYKGAPLSIVAITPALVGPYDLGVIAVRTALNVDPETAQGSALTDPLPQIFQGIPVRIRDIRLRLDRPDFTLNPTGCAEKQIAAHVTGTGGDLKSTADDTAAELTNRFQVAECASLGFKPKLSFRLFGGTHRGAHPKLKAVLRMPRGGANIASASVALPHSEFLDQGHIKTVCTRVQFAAHQCPAGSVYGQAVARTPLFDQPLQGPAYLRSSNHLLPDLVVALKGPASQPVEVDAVARVDSVNGGIRTTFDTVPDAPISSFTLTMQGAKKGLFINSTDLCAKTNRATAKFKAQNGKRAVLHPALKSSCPKHSGKRRRVGR